MHVKAKLSSYEKLSFSVTMTAPVEDWRAMLKQLEKMKGNEVYYGWPISGFADCVNKMLTDLDRTHWDTLSPEDRSALTSTDGAKL